MSDNGRHRFQQFAATGLLALLLLGILMIGNWRRHEDVGPTPAKIPSEVPTRPSEPSVARAKPPIPKVASAGVDAMVSICGFGKLPFDANDPSAAGRYIDDLTRSARNRWLAALLNSGDIRARSVGLFLKGRLASSGFGGTSDEQSRDALVQIAVGARDPAIFDRNGWNRGCQVLMAVP